MNRRTFFNFFAVAMTFSAGTAFAASVEEDLVAQLAKQGFTDISSETTWLGRLRILAKRKDGVREIVINPRTGEILRDQFTALNGKDAATQPILDDVGDGGSDNSGSDGGSSDGSGTDDNGSGSGSSGSGSGSGSSGSGGEKEDDSEDDKGNKD